MLEGKNSNLRIAEKDDVSLVLEWWRNPEYMGEHQDVMDLSKAKLEKVMLKETISFIIEKKDGTKIGHIGSFFDSRGRAMEIGYAIVPGERGKVNFEQITCFKQR